MNPRTRFVLAQLAALADADKAPQMQAYMKTDMPFFGVQTKPRRAVTAQAARDFPVTDLDSYEAALRELWDQPQRECKYAAIDLARRFKRFIVPAALPTYEHFIRDGAWWDLVDSVATHLVGGCVADCPEVMWPTIDAWISDGDLWIRRTAIICQERNRDATDVRRLFRYCAECRHETDFFIRKAIGWALRSYAYTDPRAVQDFLTRYGDELSGLTIREASKHLPRLLGKQ